MVKFTAMTHYLFDFTYMKFLRSTVNSAGGTVSQVGQKCDWYPQAENTDVKHDVGMNIRVNTEIYA